MRGLARLISSARSTLREDRALAKNELTRALIEDGNADDVAGQKITCKLHASEIATNGACERACERGLADAGHVFDQQMTFRQERDQRELDNVLLSFERTLDSLSKLLDQRELVVDYGGRRGHSVRIA